MRTFVSRQVLAFLGVVCMHRHEYTPTAKRSVLRKLYFDLHSTPARPMDLKATCRKSAAPTALPPKHPAPTPEQQHNLALPPWYPLARTLRRSDDGPRFICPHTGIRFYGVPSKRGDAEIALPGVTSVLGAQDTAEDKQRLKEWREREIQQGRNPDEGRERGTRVHSLLERFILGERPEPENKADIPFYEGMRTKLGDYEEFLWSEKPLISGWEHVWSGPPSDPRRLARVWSEIWGAAGTPDIIGRLKNRKYALADFKTSNQPYFRPTRNHVPRHRVTGYKKYKKTVRQMCAYSLLIKETLNIEIEEFQIIVGLRAIDEAQSFWIDSSEIARETETVKQLCARFWEQQQERMSKLAVN